MKPQLGYFVCVASVYARSAWPCSVSTGSRYFVPSTPVLSVSPLARTSAAMLSTTRCVVSASGARPNATASTLCVCR